MSTANPETPVNLDPTIPAPMTNVAEYGFEGRFEEWADDARYFEYSKAANPIGSGHAPQVPIVRFGPEIYMDQPTGVVPLDLSKQLGIKTGEATSPALLANFLRIRTGEQIGTSPNATSQLYYVLYGRGFAAINGHLAKWEKGDFLTLPAGCHAVFYADADAAMYWVHDEPLLRYLGADATRPRFRPTKFRRTDAVAKLEDIASRPAGQRQPGADADHHPRAVGHVRCAAGRPGAAPAPAPVGRAGSDTRCATQGLLHATGHPARRAR
jgi:mannose-6-phosphate isomerase-like protein (cupin superfamily)